MCPGNKQGMAFREGKSVEEGNDVGSRVYHVRKLFCTVLGRCMCIWMGIFLHDITERAVRGRIHAEYVGLVSVCEGGSSGERFGRLINTSFHLKHQPSTPVAP
jgi:hypothetical protein